MRKTFPLLLIIALMANDANAQIDNFKFKLYGFVRGDLFYNSRANVESFDGVFLLYPSDRLPDTNGNDLNAVSNSGFYMMTTRLGVDISGPKMVGATSTAKIEGDFAGISGNHTLVRIRQAYFKLNWANGSSLLMGQTWHPLFGEVAPRVLNVSTGAPYQPFSRTPQLNYRYTFGNLSLTAAALFQSQFLSSGPDGKSMKYARNAVIPELFAGVTYKNTHVLLTAGVDILTLKPRTQSVFSGRTYQVDENISTTSFMVAGSYSKKLFSLSAKSVLGQNLSHVTQMGGYGVSEIDPISGEYTYTPFKHITSWLNATYGKKYQGGIFLGHTKNLGSQNSLVATDKVYGQGLNIDRMIYAAGQFSYNLPSLTLGLEYALNTAYYGDIALNNGKVTHTHAVTNHRWMALLAYYF